MTTWKAIAQRKQAERDALIPIEWRIRDLPSAKLLNVMDVPRSCGILTSKEIEITENHDATSLAEAIKQQSLTCVEVTTAYCKRAAIAQQLLNCLTEILFEEALVRAKELDQQVKQGQTLGPLHGVPVSLKDQFSIKGKDASLGMAALCYKPSTTNAHLVDLLYDAGAVFYCKTNVPQSMGALDSVNNIFGRTFNPFNRLVTAGGSSGGEGALVGFKGSVLGIGTDIGGSIRIPAMCNGIYGVKPSAFRIPYDGIESCSPKSTEVGGLMASAGPLARSMRDCELLLKIVSEAKPWRTDPKLMPGLWESDDRADVAQKQLVVGILEYDNHVQPLPPIARILEEVSQQLSSNNIKIVRIATPAILGESQALASKLMSYDGSHGFMSVLEAYGEPLIDWLRPFTRRREQPTFEKMRTLHEQRGLMCANLAKTLWRIPGTSEEFDAIICPVAPHPTPKIDMWGTVGYTLDWVMTDYPAGVIPVRQIQPSDLDEELPVRQSGGRTRAADMLNRRLWPERNERNVYLNTWLCIQVLTPRLQERRLLRCMTAIDSVLKKKSMVLETTARL